MRGGTGSLPGWDGTFTGIRDVYRLAFISTFCRRDNEDLLVLAAILNLLCLRMTYCKKRNVSKNRNNCPWQGGMKHLYGKNRPAQAGIPVAETGIPPRRDGTKNLPPP